MSATDAVFAGSIPAVYQEYLVPMLFEPYAEDIAGRVSDVRTGVLVEIAAGTGAVTRALRKTLPPTVEIIATDFNEAMLRVGAVEVSGPALTWRHADARELPFADGSADVVLCQFGIMFVPDKGLAYREALRVLRPGGRYVFNVWDRVENNEVSAIVTRAVGTLFPSDPPRFFERTPFGSSDTAVIEQQLRSAGFKDIAIETVRKVTRVRSAEHAATGLCKGTPLRGEIETRDAARLDEATKAAAAALETRFGAGAFDNVMHAHVITARA